MSRAAPAAAAAAPQDQEAELASLFDKLNGFIDHEQHGKALKVAEQSEFLRVGR